MGTQRQEDFPAYLGQEACREDGIYCEAGTLPGGLPGSGKTFQAQGHSLYGAVLPGKKAMRRTGFPHTQGKESAGTMALPPVLTYCPADSRVQEDFPGISPRLIWGCTVRQKGGAADGLSAYSGQEACRGDGISSGAGTLPSGLPGSGRIPRYMGNTAPKQIPPQHRPGHAAGGFSCTGTGRIRLRHRATWRRWDSRERRLPKPGRR